MGGISHDDHLREMLVNDRSEEGLRLFPDYTPGAMAALGGLDGLRAYMGRSLADERELVFKGANSVDDR